MALYSKSSETIWFQRKVYRYGLEAFIQLLVLVMGKLRVTFNRRELLNKGTIYLLVSFIIGAGVLSRGLIGLVDTKKTNPFSKPSHCPTVLHLRFADDMVIFTNGSKKSLQNLMNFLTQYETELGQLISRRIVVL